MCKVERSWNEVSGRWSGSTSVDVQVSLHAGSEYSDWLTACHQSAE
jgi:hypothetical protein